MAKNVIVNIWYRGVRTSFMVDAIIGKDDKVRIHQDQLDAMLNVVGVIPGDVFSIGA